MMPEEKTEEIPSFTLTPSSTFTAIPSPSPLPSSTSYPLPTLELTQFAGEIHTFLTQGEDCPSPCLFGIIPGQTPLEDAIKTFSWLRHPLMEKNFPDGPEYYNTVIGIEDNNLYIVVDLFGEKHIVKNMVVGMTLSKDKQVSNIGAWKAYSTKNILDKYGVPSRVGLFLSFPTEEGFPLNTAWYDMILFYDEQDFTIEYFHGLTREEDLIKACPASDLFTKVTIFLGKDLEYPPYGGVPLEKVTSMTVEQFTDLLQEGSGSACFEISKAVFFGQN